MEGLTRLLSRRALVVALFLSLGAAAGQRVEPARAQNHPGGHFTLVDQQGRKVSDGDFRDKYLLVTFGYTFCPDICPLTLRDIALVMEQLGDLAARVQPLFITVDPERDTPEVLGRFVTAFDPRILGLTGTPEQIRGAAAAYFVQYDKAKEGDSYLMNHSSFTHLIGPDGTYLTSFLYGFKPEAVAEEIRERINATQ
jgi:cytochrome oxidase Cu insertion factor (SCO1/SenC/PrrC family)